MHSLTLTLSTSFWRRGSHSCMSALPLTTASHDRPNVCACPSLYIRLKQEARLKSGRLPPGPLAARLPRVTLGPVTRVAPFSYLHKQKYPLHLTLRWMTAVTHGTEG